MKTFYTTLLSLLLLPFASNVATAQSLHLNNTRFIGGDTSCYSEAQYSVPTKDKGILFVGYTTCTGGGDIPSDSIASLGGGGILIGKIDSNQNLSWVKVYGGSWLEWAKGACQTPDSGYAILAYTKSNDGDVSGNHGGGGGDLWLVRTDTKGNLLWQKCYGSIYDEQPIAIANTPDNGFILFGASNGAGGDVPTHYSGSQFDWDWLVIKVDSLGNKQWAKSFGGTGQEDFSGSIFYADSGYYFAGLSSSTDYDCTDTSWHSHSVNTSDDFYLFKLDTAGNILWRKSYGGSRSDEVWDAIYDNRDSSIVMVGSTQSNDYMVTGNHGGGNDMLVVKTDENGNLIWTQMPGGYHK